MAGYTLAVANAIARGTGNLTPTISAISGRLAILFAASQGAASDSITTPSGWTLLATRSNHTSIFGRVLTGGDTYPAVNFAATFGHFAQVAEFEGSVYSDLATIAHTSANAFGSSATVPTIPNITITQPNCLVIIAGWHVKTATSNGSTYDDVAGFTEIGESRPTGGGVDMVWNYQQQTSAASLSGLSRSMTGTTENGQNASISLALLSVADPTNPWPVYTHRRSTLVTL